MWYYVDNGQQQGPFDEAQFEGLIAGGTVNPGTYVWKEGQPNWLPLGQVRGGLSQGDTCQVCQKPVGADNLIELSGVRVCAACKPVALQSLLEGVAVGNIGVWAEGKRIVARDGALFPQRCVKCNAPTSGEAMKRKLFWHPPAYYLFIFLHIIIYIIVAIIVRKRATIHVHLCPQHQRRRLYFLIATWLGLPLGLGLIMAGIATKSTLGVVAGIVLFLAACGVGLFGARITWTARIKEKTVWLGGVGKDFRASLPPWNGS